MCNCAKRRWNIAQAAQAVLRGDVKAAAGEAKAFVQSSAEDLKAIGNGGQGPTAT
jgi:hypothetical protein